MTRRVRQYRELLRDGPAARRYFAALAQSALGTGAAYVALLIIAYERVGKAWAVAAILAAEFVPPVFFGSLLGALADRRSRRQCLIAADVLRAGAFAVMAVTHGIGPLLGCALIAGAASSLFNSASLAALPQIAGAEQMPAATGLYGAITETGYTLGPALAAPLIGSVGPTSLLWVNAASFAISAGVLSRTPIGGRIETEEEPTLRQQLREGWAASLGHPGARALILATSALALCVGMMNVGEVLLVKRSLGAGDAALSLLVAASGVGIVAGSLAAGRAGGHERLLIRYVIGYVACGGGLALCGLAPDVPAAVAAFALAGFGNGYVLANERVLLQRNLRAELLGRVFGLKNSLISAAMGASLGVGALALGLLTPRQVLVGAGVAALAALLVAWPALRGWSPDAPTRPVRLASRPR